MVLEWGKFLWISTHELTPSFPAATIVVIPAVTAAAAAAFIALDVLPARDMFITDFDGFVAAVMTEIMVRNEPNKIQRRLFY